VIKIRGSPTKFIADTNKH